ncbi:MAG TPA: tail fiber domain-containing protein [Candidatus Baltobacteraceae bacterium]|jgi:hypothetical protein|nr:tail fiber domain-containing protein [Candidatus Baltobacteraceae bacterium]
MKYTSKCSLWCFVALVMGASTHQVFAQGTAFTYQGRLNANGASAGGLYDFRFRLSTDSQGDNYVGSAFLTNAIPVTNGLFTTQIDFGAGIFTGSNYWLEVDVRTNNPGNTLSYTGMTPLQQLTPTPYAVFANTASNVLGIVSAAQIGGTVLNSSLPASPTFSGLVTASSFTGNGANVTDVNAQSLNGLAAIDFWQLTGNSGTTPGVNFVGTSDNEPLELHVNGERALRLEVGGPSRLTSTTTPTGAPNVIGGSQLNYVAFGAVGSVIAGGGATNFDGQLFSNSIGLYSDFSVIGGGLLNFIETNCAVSTISGGQVNSIETNSYNSTIGGGAYNGIGANSIYSTIGGGAYNDIGAESPESTINGGYSNRIDTNSAASTIAGGDGDTIASSSDHSTIAGGEAIFIGSSSGHSTVAGGSFNDIANGSDHATIAGGDENNIEPFSGFSTIAGGQSNNVSYEWATVAGGENNTAEYEWAAIGGGDNNTNAGDAGTIAGGQNNLCGLAYQPTVGGGYGNQANNGYATVPGGYGNIAGAEFSFAAGLRAHALHEGAFVWADSQVGPFSSTANDEFSIGATGGVRIQSPKGVHLNAADEPIIVRDWDVFAANAPSDKAGIGRWGLFMEPSILTIGIPSNDVSPRYFQIAKYSTNGVASGLMQVDQSGNVIAKGNITANGVLITSDRNAKENFTALDATTVLAKVVAMPVTQWNYKEDAAKKHVGPMAQDFHAAFQLDGADDKHISVIDEGGVALAAIQGLNQKLNEKDAQIEALTEKVVALNEQSAQIQDLKQSVAELRHLVQSLAERK